MGFVTIATNGQYLGNLGFLHEVTAVHEGEKRYKSEPATLTSIVADRDSRFMHYSFQSGQGIASLAIHSNIESSLRLILGVLPGNPLEGVVVQAFYEGRVLVGIARQQLRMPLRL